MESFIDSRALVCANSGGGKSYLVRKILEETSGKVMSIILDVEGEFKTLREKYDFLLIGNNADVPLSLKSAELLPRKLLELNVSTIIDISDLKMNERIQYAKHFLEALMELPRELWKPCIIVLDESHLLAGQQEKQDSTHAVIDLMTRGRKRGYCGILCSQRISKLHKDAVAEANNYLVGRTGLDIDMKRASEILGFTEKKDMLSLRDLDPGEFYVFGPAISKHVEKEKVGQVKTTHPKVGMDLRGKIVSPTEKIKEILTKISELPKEAEKEAKTIKEMQTKIKGLVHEIRILKISKPKPEADERALERARQIGFKDAEQKYLIYIKPLEENSKKLRMLLGKIIKDASSFLESKSFQIIGDIPPIKMSNPEVEPKLHFKIERSVNVVSNEDIKLGLAEKKIYTLLCQYPDRLLSKQQIGVFTGYRYRGGGFNNALGRLNSFNLIERTGDSARVKDVNQDLMGDYDFSIKAMINKLGKCEREIFEVLLEEPNREFTKEEIAEQTPSNYESLGGGFNNALGRLNTFGIVEKKGNSIKINPELLEL